MANEWQAYIARNQLCTVRRTSSGMYFTPGLHYHKPRELAKGGSGELLCPVGVVYLGGPVNRRISTRVRMRLNSAATAVTHLHM